MPRRPKPPMSWTTNEAMKRLFPKRVRDWLNKVAHEKDYHRQPHAQSVPEK